MTTLRDNDYERFGSDGEFADAVTADMQSISGDKHLRLLCEEPAPPVRPRRHGFDKVEILDGNIGYLENTIFRSPRQYGDTAAAAMTLVADTDALIIDLRRNRGGEPAMVAFVCAYLFDEFTHLNDLYLRSADLTVQFWTPEYVPGRRFGGTKPIWVLTGPITFSAGEELAYNLQQLRRATIVGEVGRGGAHGSVFRPINEELVAMIPHARAINPVTGTNWQGVGVKPDVEVPAEDALAHAYELAKGSVSGPVA
ncbi:MAG TPA: S41 family peptidase [Pseudonocardiaceae bacterium]|nr:S41 family peptidase [Pseudonocardiaceae bacterium]